jgi:hypothetical protein
VVETETSSDQGLPARPGMEVTSDSAGPPVTVSTPTIRMMLPTGFTDITLLIGKNERRAGIARPIRIGAARPASSRIVERGARAWSLQPGTSTLRRTQVAAVVPDLVKILAPASSVSPNDFRPNRESSKGSRKERG